MNNPNRQYQFNKMYYNYIIDCLAQDDLIEELCYVYVAVDTGIRIKEMAMLKWGQYDFDKFLNVQISKLRPKQGEQFYGDISLSRSTSLKLHEYRELINPDANTPIFKNISKIADSIKKSIGYSRFTLHDLRRMAFVFRTELINTINIPNSSNSLRDLDCSRNPINESQYIFKKKEYSYEF